MRHCNRYVISVWSRFYDDWFPVTYINDRQTALELYLELERKLPGQVKLHHEVDEVPDIVFSN